MKKSINSFCLLETYFEFIFQYHFHLASSFKLWIFYFWIMTSCLWAMDWRQCQSSEKHFGAFLFLTLFCFPLLPVTKIRQLLQWELHWGWPWIFNCILGTFYHKFRLFALLKVAFYCHPFLCGSVHFSYLQRVPDKPCDPRNFVNQVRERIESWKGVSLCKSQHWYQWAT